MSAPAVEILLVPAIASVVGTVWSAVYFARKARQEEVPSPQGGACADGAGQFSGSPFAPPESPFGSREPEKTSRRRFVKLSRSAGAKAARLCTSGHSVVAHARTGEVVGRDASPPVEAKVVPEVSAAAEPFIPVVGGEFTVAASGAVEVAAESEFFRKTYSGEILVGKTSVVSYPSNPFAQEDDSTESVGTL